MEWRFYTPDDHNMVAEWWKAWGWRVIPPASLPQRGVIALDNDNPVACAWLYQTDCCVAMIGFFITNRKVSRRKRNDALEVVIKALCLTARELGYTTVFCTVMKKGLARLIERQGFAYREENNINLFKVLDYGI